MRERLADIREKVLVRLECANRCSPEIEKDYMHHSAPARLLAEEYFGSAKILSRLVKQVIAPALP
jgi:hypothetical protein